MKKVSKNSFNGGIVPWSEVSIVHVFLPFGGRLSYPNPNLQNRE